MNRAKILVRKSQGPGPISSTVSFRLLKVAAGLRKVWKRQDNPLSWELQVYLDILFLSRFVVAWFNL